MLSESEWSLELLGAWRLFAKGEPVHVAPRQQRLIAALALMGPRPRVALAGLLWPGNTDTRASGNLRATLWYVSHELPNLLTDTHGILDISSGVEVDIRNLQCSVKTLLNGDSSRPLELLEQLKRAELLPGWYEDWLLFQQEHLGQIRLSALDALARQFMANGDFEQAVTASASAVSIEPLREKSHRLLIEAFLASGNVAAAIKDFKSYRSRLRLECGVQPSTQLTRLIAAIQNVPRSPIELASSPGGYGTVNWPHLGDF
ncbi:BTAD domain-containing putative transcriptional regulator [Arthrobacter sp. ok362]|uniref:AfsR/SARP family transcriptional regulator n=1 Tax=Arthrobacter sp. ok362 TaxID=1761745 RepID=UPI000886F0DF|nr:BTAD domain-containing putative transcriptional regulator [Arthrobacter sp. ok362]SDK59259.1 DNA-binding transcriptional activator of the SARP family [Arthrobacter sp. ok362]